MVVVYEDMDLPGQQAPLAQVRVEIAGANCEPIAGPVHVGAGTTIIGAKRLKPGAGIAANGYWQLDLVPNSAITPTGTGYLITRRTSDGDVSTSCISLYGIYATGGPYGVSQVLSAPPGPVPSPCNCEGDVTQADLGGHANATIDNSVHGVVLHEWGPDDWTTFTPVVISADAGQVQTTIVTGGQGIVSAAGPNGGLRVGYLRSGTNWDDSEITSMVVGPTADWLGNNAQQGHLHRVRQISPGLYEAIAIWTSVVFGNDYRFLHAAPIRFDGTTLFQGTNSGVFGSSGNANFDRRQRVLQVERTNVFGVFLNQYSLLHPERLSIAIGDIVTAINHQNGTFNFVTGAVFDVNELSSILTVQSAVTGTAALAVDRGLIGPDGVDLQKRWTPFYMSTRVVGGTAASCDLQIKRWRTCDPEPDWSDSTRVQRGQVLPDIPGGVPTVPTDAGLCGIWNAHYFNGSGGAWGTIRFERVIPTV